jgi:gluconate 5-dehydrogenase
MVEVENTSSKVGQTGGLGNAAVYLASPASDFVTGQILYVDGGLLSTFGPITW